MTLTRPRAQIQCDNAEGSFPPIGPSSVLMLGIRWMGRSNERTAPKKILGQQNPGLSGELLLAEQGTKATLMDQ
jgi:hypothetical protein